jgi:hypothetical protein
MRLGSLVFLSVLLVSAACRSPELQFQARRHQSRSLVSREGGSVGQVRSFLRCGQREHGHNVRSDVVLGRDA